MSKFVLCVFVIAIFINHSLAEINHEQVKVFTVASEYTDGYERYLRSAKYYGISVETLGMGVKWEGGDMSAAGGGHKVNFLKEALKPYQNDDKTIIIFTDSYDVVFTAGLDEIVKKFKNTGAKILFGAEYYCWPDGSLKNKYPPVQGKGPRFLNSGGFIGYASNIYDILRKQIKNNDDDQLYYTHAYLDSETRLKHNFKLDHKSEIFQNLNGAKNEVKLEIEPRTGDAVIQNIETLTTPHIIHANGPSKVHLNTFGNYLAGAFEKRDCKICNDYKVQEKIEPLPVVSLALFIEKAVPFLEEYLNNILAINYPKKSIHLFIHNQVAYHEETVKSFIEKHGGDYKTVKTILSAEKFNEREARHLAVQQAQQKESDYIFVVDADAHIDDPNTLQDLLQYNRTFIAPVLVRPNQLWSNFWGALSETGFYARSVDYMDIVKDDLEGMWNVPFVSSCYLVKKSAFKHMKFEHSTSDPDMALCQHLRDAGIFMYVVNTEYYGHLVNGDDYNTELASPDFYMLLTNKADWEKRYIHPEYKAQLTANFTHKQPCTDVYWIPIASDQFCKELIIIMENFGKWSDGSNEDKRLEGGYEAVPTRDIHMNQVGLEPLWLYFLKEYIRPLQEAIFIGYYHNPPKSLMNFVVRYRPDEQPFLRPHHDSSTYTINIALNRAGIDYEGGGCRFLRYNCSVEATKMGWMLMHPGRLTHMHEGLLVTKGTRYIMISFVDP